MGHGVASGPEFWNRTHTRGTCGYDTAELPVPVLYPSHLDPAEDDVFDYGLHLIQGLLM